MTADSGIQAHPAADLFPLLSGDEYEAFKADIAANGLLEPIWIYSGQILDGRNRYRACLDIGVEPRFRTYEGDTPVAFVWSLNGERRHLSESQRATIGHKMLPELREEAKKRMAHGETAPGKRPASIDAGRSSRPTRAVDQAAEKVGVGSATVNRVDYVYKRDPELYRQIETGEITATKAVSTIKERDNPEPKKADPGERADQVRDMAAQGYISSQIASALGVGVQHVRNIASEHGIDIHDRKGRAGGAHKIKPERVVSETVNGLDGYVLGVRALGGSLEGISPDDAREWAASIAESLKTIKKLQKQLEEIANG